MEETSIIELVRAGNTDAFSDIIEHYQTPIQRYLYRLTGDFDLAQDLTQDTFIQAYKGILKTTAEISFKAWLYRIATNNALQYHRRKKILTFIPFTLLKNRVSIEENGIDCTGETAAIQEALRYVPEEQRMCLVLHFVEGFKYKEIAVTLSISEEAVRKRVARGKKLFIEHYDRDGDGLR